MSRPTFADFKKRALENPEVKAAYEELAPEFDLRRKLIEVRMASGLTQEELAKRMGTTKGNISRLESANGKHSPTLSTLASYADAAGFKLDLRFLPAR